MDKGAVFILTAAPYHCLSTHCTQDDSKDGEVEAIELEDSIYLLYLGWMEWLKLLNWGILSIYCIQDDSEDEDEDGEVEAIELEDSIYLLFLG